VIPAGSAAQLIVWLQLAASLVMVGVIWYVQLVHYPLMARAERQGFSDFHRQHSRRTGWVVIGPMVVEAITSTLLVVPGVATVPRPAAAAGLALVVLLWLSTFAVQVPLHHRLSRGFDAAAHGRLVATNWVRTVLWSARGVVALTMAVAAGSHA
jgi:hypothetical protein